MEPAAAWRELVYASVDGTELSFRRYRPVTRAADDGLRPAVVIVDGGGFGPADVLGSAFHKRLAADGAVVLVVQTRSHPEHRHPAATLDVERALRRIASRAGELGVDPDAVVLVGVGSGAHALLGAFHRSPAVRRMLQPRAVVVWQPQVDPLTAERSGHRSEAARAYFGPPERMRRAGIPEQLLDSDVGQLPQLIATRSRHLAPAPAVVTDELAYGWRLAGGRAEVVETDAEGFDESELGRVVRALCGLSCPRGADDEITAEEATA